MEYQFESMGPLLRIVVLVFMLVFALLLLALAVLLAALPGQIAKARNHPQHQAVNVCGWVGLPTGILWAIALVWAFWVDDSNVPNASPLNANLAKQLDQIEASLSALETKLKGAHS